MDVKDAGDGVGEVDAAAAVDMNWLPVSAFVAFAVVSAAHSVEPADLVDGADSEGTLTVPFPIASWSKPEENDLFGALVNRVASKVFALSLTLTLWKRDLLERRYGDPIVDDEVPQRIWMNA
jgi:hypothetical protein